MYIAALQPRLRCGLGSAAYVPHDAQHRHTEQQQVRTLETFRQKLGRTHALQLFEELRVRTSPHVRKQLARNAEDPERAGTMQAGGLEHIAARGVAVHYWLAAEGIRNINSLFLEKSQTIPTSHCWQLIERHTRVRVFLETHRFRQYGREGGRNVIGVRYDHLEITDDVRKQLQREPYAPDHIYGDSYAAEKNCGNLGASSSQSRRPSWISAGYIQ